MAGGMAIEPGIGGEIAEVEGLKAGSLQSSIGQKTYLEEGAYGCGVRGGALVDRGLI